jgi:hypothetical protein
MIGHSILHCRIHKKLLFLMLTGIGTAAGQFQTAITERPATVRVDVTPGHSINSFDPDSALGSSIDVLSRRDIDKVYTPHILQESLSAGWGPITYRNNTELRMAAWYWTQNGTWSDPAHRSSYFTGSTDLREPVRYILAYALPHRGFATRGDRPVQGPNLTYWKSNPYLTSRFTGEKDSLHPQWVVIDLNSEKTVNAVRIVWASPHATTYQVEYWTGTRALDFDAGPLACAQSAAGCMRPWPAVSLASAGDSSPGFFGGNPSSFSFRWYVLTTTCPNARMR